MRWASESPEGLPEEARSLDYLSGLAQSMYLMGQCYFNLGTEKKNLPRTVNTQRLGKEVSRICVPRECFRGSLPPKRCASCLGLLSPTPSRWVPGAGDGGMQCNQTYDFPLTWPMEPRKLGCLAPLETFGEADGNGNGYGFAGQRGGYTGEMLVIAAMPGEWSTCRVRPSM
jgi:hypothetical protein